MRCGRRSARLRIMFGFERERRGITKRLARCRVVAFQIRSEMTRRHFRSCQCARFSNFCARNLATRQTEHHFSSFLPRLRAIMCKTGNCFYSDCGKMCYWLVTLRAYNIFLIQLSLLLVFFLTLFFRRQWKSISMFWCFRLLCLSRSHSGTTPCCVLDKTMIMFYENEISSKDSRI